MLFNLSMSLSDKIGLIGIICLFLGAICFAIFQHKIMFTRGYLGLFKLKAKDLNDKLVLLGATSIGIGLMILLVGFVIKKLGS